MRSSRLLRCSIKHMLNCLHRHPSVQLSPTLRHACHHSNCSTSPLLRWSASNAVAPPWTRGTVVHRAAATSAAPCDNPLNSTTNSTASTATDLIRNHLDTTEPSTADDDDDDDDDDLGPGPGPGSSGLLHGLSTHSPHVTPSPSPLPPLPPALYVIPTPIGNLRDITLRAADTLRGVSLLLAEDTRHTRKLLNFLGIRHIELLSCHEHNEKLRLTRVMQRLQQGEAVGLVSDAGMPGISDPGHAVIAAAVAAGVRVVALPGPCAGVTALVASGLPTQAFTFVGFLPPKSGARRRALQLLAAQPATLLLYAPPHGLAGVLADCVEVLGGGRRCCVAREISKVHEEYFRSTLAGALREWTEVRQPRGEICLVVEGAVAEAAGGPGGDGDSEAGSAAGGGGGGARGGEAGAPAAGAVERVLRELLEAGMPVSAAVKEVVENLGAKKKAAYATALRLSESIGKRGEQGQQQSGGAA